MFRKVLILAECWWSNWSISAELVVSSSGAHLLIWSGLDWCWHENDSLSYFRENRFSYYEMGQIITVHCVPQNEMYNIHYTIYKFSRKYFIKSLVLTLQLPLFLQFMQPQDTSYLPKVFAYTTTCSGIYGRTQSPCLNSSKTCKFYNHEFLGRNQGFVSNLRICFLRSNLLKV